MEKTSSWAEVSEKIDGIDVVYSMQKEVEEIIFNSVAALEKGVYLEIGTAYGRTLFAAGTAAKGRDVKCYGIDDLSLLARDADEKIRKTCEGLPVELIVGRSDQVEWNLPIDILVIDGCHVASEVKKDYEKYVPFLKSGGLLIVDDWSEPVEFEDPVNVHWGIAYYGRLTTEGWEELPSIGTRARFFKKP